MDGANRWGQHLHRWPYLGNGDGCKCLTQAGQPRLERSPDLEETQEIARNGCLKPAHSLDFGPDYDYNAKCGKLWPFAAAGLHHLAIIHRWRVRSILFREPLVYPPQWRRVRLRLTLVPTRGAC